MSLYLKTHIVKEGETLEQIIALYDIPTLEMLLYFHHLHVPKAQNHIGKAIYEGQEIFVPTKDDIKKILSERKNLLHENLERRFGELLNQNLVFPFKAGLYSYLVTLNDSESERTYTMHLELEYFYKNEEGFSFLKINQSEIKFNNTIPNLSTEIISSEINKNLFPLNILVNKKGLIENVHHIHELQQRWNRNKSELSEFVEGDIGNRILEQVSYKITDSKILKEYINNNILWGLLLHGVVGKYENGICEKEIQLLNEKEKFDAKNRILKNEEYNSRYYYISQEIKKENISSLKINIEYKLNIDSHMLEGADINLQNHNEKIKINIQKTQI